MRIFLAIPAEPEFVEVDKIIGQVILEKNHELTRIDEALTNGARFAQVQEQIKKADLLIADVSNRNANVMYELGLARSENKPVLPIIKQEERLPFDIDSMRTLRYDSDRLNETLGMGLRDYFDKTEEENFIENKIKENKEERNKMKAVFVSYSHMDVKFLDRLRVHLRPFEKSGAIDLWVDTKIKAGEKWKEEIEEALERSAIAILLVSADFLASDFIIDNELPPLLSTAEEKGKVVLPVVLKPCRFAKDKNLSKFQSINDPKMPLSKMSDNDREEIYVKIADRIEESIQ